MLGMNGPIALAIASSIYMLALSACASSNDVIPGSGEITPSLSYRAGERSYIHVVQQGGWYANTADAQLSAGGEYDVGGDFADCSTETMDCGLFGQATLITWPRPFNGGSWEFEGVRFNPAVLSEADGAFLVSPSRDGVPSMAYVISCPTGVLALIALPDRYNAEAKRFDLVDSSPALLRGCAEAERPVTNSDQ